MNDAHMTKHFNQSIMDLVTRMLLERKLYCGMLNKNALKYLRDINVIDDKVIEINTNEIIGCFVDRYFNIYETNTIRVVIKNHSIHTAYPSKTNAKKIKTYNILNHPIIKSLDKTNYSLFCLLYKNNYDFHLNKKRNGLKVSINDYNIDIKNNYLMVLQKNRVLYETSFKYSNLISILNQIKKYNPNQYSIFGHISLNDFMVGNQKVLIS